MNFHIFNTSKTFGGQEIYIKILAKELYKNNVNIYLTGSPEVLRIAIRKFSIEVDGECLALVEPDRCVLINGNRALYESLFRRKKNSIWTYVQHSSFHDSQAGALKPIIRSWLLKLLMRRVDAVVRVADNALPDNWAPGKITTIYNGVDLSQYPCRTHWRQSSLAPVQLLMVGAINANKNQRLAIEVLVHLPLARLTILGQGADQTMLAAMAQRLGVSDRVVWAGQQENPASYYREADVLLMLSQFEAMPFVVLESMASGTPVVGFPVGGVPEVIDNGVSGVLIAERSPLALAHAIDQLMQDLPGLQSMGLRARDRIEGGFTAERMATSFLQLVEQVRQKRSKQATA